MEIQRQLGNKRAAQWEIRGAKRKANQEKETNARRDERKQSAQPNSEEPQTDQMELCSRGRLLGYLHLPPGSATERQKAGIENHGKFPEVPAQEIRQGRNHNEVDLHYRDRKQGRGASPYDHQPDSRVGYHACEDVEIWARLHQAFVQRGRFPGACQISVQGEQNKPQPKPD